MARRMSLQPPKQAALTLPTSSRRRMRGRSSAAQAKPSALPPHRRSSHAPTLLTHYVRTNAPKRASASRRRRCTEFARSGCALALGRGSKLSLRQALCRRMRHAVRNARSGEARRGGTDLIGKSRAEVELESAVGGVMAEMAESWRQGQSPRARERPALRAALMVCVPDRLARQE